jgi:3-methyladenine DNA glycosylase AlkC
MKNQNGPGFSLKDHLFNQERVQYLAGLFSAADAGFDAAGFVKHTMKQLEQFELKARIVHIATVLERFLPSDFRAAARQIVDALPEPLDPHRTDDDFGDFIFAPLGEYVVRNGLSAKHLKLSLSTLKEITQRFSMEDSVRAFINAFPEHTLAELSRWSTDHHYHVRRLVSEGTRPLLPWSARLSIDCMVPLPLLDQLYADPTRYVTRSVANHLNDVSKQQPQVVLQMLQRWKTEGRQSEPELQWMTKHALRTLIKRGDRDTLEFLGYSTQPKITVTEFRLQPAKLNPGDTFEFSLTVTAGREEQLVVDYVIDFVKAGGRRSSRVHKLRQVRLKRGESVTISKRHTLRADATTYTLYPGIHSVTIQINGKSCGQQCFELLPGDT